VAAEHVFPVVERDDILDIFVEAGVTRLPAHLSVGGELGDAVVLTGSESSEAESSDTPVAARDYVRDPDVRDPTVGRAAPRPTNVPVPVVLPYQSESVGVAFGVRGAAPYDDAVRQGDDVAVRFAVARSLPHHLAVRAGDDEVSERVFLVRLPDPVYVPLTADEGVPFPGRCDVHSPERGCPAVGTVRAVPAPFARLVGP
jgi:hypothetical protein